MPVMSGAVATRSLRGLQCVTALLLLDIHSASAGFEYDERKGMESARLFGNVYQYAYYFTDLLVGHPNPQRASVIIDTGSRLVGFPCSGCHHCGSHLDPAYNTSRSETLTWQSCNSHCPDTCYESLERCPYRETYAEGSEISGFWFEDLVELGDAFSKNPPVRATLGCHYNENNLFYTQRANGIMGLAPSSGIQRQPSFLQTMFQDREHVNTDMFSICLATWGGRLNVGGYDDSVHVKEDNSDTIKWIKLRAAHYYYIMPTGMHLGGSEGIDIATSARSFGTTIVDSGTTFSYLPHAVYTSLREALDNYCDRHDCRATPDGKDCWLVTSADGPVMFPPIRFDFQGVMVNWWPESYLHEVGPGGRWCAAFMEGQMTETVLGISFMLHKDFVFDLAQGLLGIADADCPEYREQPYLPEQKFLVGPAKPRLGSSMKEHTELVSDRAAPVPSGAKRRVWLAAAGTMAALSAVALATFRFRWLKDSHAASAAACRLPTVDIEETRLQADAQGAAMALKEGA